MISHGLISRSDTITYVPIGLLRSSLRLGLDLTRSSRLGSPNWDDLIRADTFREVHREQMRSVMIVVSMFFTIMIEGDHDLSYDWTPDGYIYAAGLTMEFIVS